MPSLQRSFLVLLGLSLFLVPLATQAQQCGCFCGSNATGAQGPENKANAVDCKTTCDQANLQYVGCFENPDDYPQENDLCWTEAECDAYSSKTYSGDTKEGIWGKQHYTCTPGSGHCYSTGIPVSLNVPLLGVAEVSDLPTYVDLAYKFLLPTAALIAVVIAMIAGVQYATAGGNQTQVTKAKQRVANAVIGVVLLLSAYVIARLIDPRLVTLSSIRVPMVKQVVLVDPNSTCDVLIGYGFTISPPNGVCGNKGTVTSVDNVIDKVANSNIKVGDQCSFLGCAKPGEACMSDGICRTCDSSEIPEPSPSVCATIATTADINDTDPDHKYFCSFDATLDNACVLVRTAFDPYLNCDVIKSQVPPENPCSVYDRNAYISASDGSFHVFEVTSYIQEASKICEDDPCNVSAAACEAVEGFALDGINCVTR